MGKILTVIVPYRNRLENLLVFAKCIELVDKAQVDFLLISLGDDSPEVQRICVEAGIKYFYEADLGMFRIGHAHNIGARLAKTPYIMKMDVDLLAFTGLYEQIAERLIGIKNRHTYFVPGCYFAGREFSEKYLNGMVTLEHIDQLKRFPEQREKILSGRPEGTMFIINREHYLEFGGCHEEFSGHAWEDYQVIYCAEKFCRPDLRLPDYYPNTIRTRLVLPKNIEASAFGWTFIHRWHPKVNDPGYYDQRGKNAAILSQILRNFKLPEQVNKDV